MATTNYFTVNGEITGETGPNGTMIYHTDALGSVTTTSDQNGNKLNDYRYKPYGALLSKSGTAPDPEFQWVGSFGYRRTSLPHSGSYMRNRHYGMEEGRWTTVDLLWPAQQQFIYVHARTPILTDPSGLLSINLNSFISSAMPGQTTAYVCSGQTEGNWIPMPLNPAGLDYVKGDNRTFFVKGTSRIHSFLVVPECSIGSMSAPIYAAECDESTALRINSNDSCYETVTGKADVSRSARIIAQARGRVSGSTLIQIEYSAGFPLIPLAPHIRLSGELKLTINYCTGAGTASLNVDHTRFPWFEAYATSQYFTGKKPIYTFTPPIKDFLELLGSDVKTAGSVSFHVRGGCKKCKCQTK